LKIKGIFLGPSVFLLQNPFKLYGFLTFQFWAYMMKVILSIYDEGYFEHIWWRLFWAYMMKVILSIYDEGYFEHIWWRLFWAYIMKVISEACRPH
jgi:hypothetical protein